MPLEAINIEAAREKSIRHGHPSTLHLWWARRPLAACRAVLFCQLVDDPSSVPEQFPTEAEQDEERERLYALIGDFVKWESSTDEEILNEAKREVARSIARWRYDCGEAESVDETMLRGTPSPLDIGHYLTTKAPAVYDPFCGGGSIPLEAQRLGLKSVSSDLNPVAVLITKALTEIPSIFVGRCPVNPEAQARAGMRNWDGAQGLADDVRYYGNLIRSEALNRIGHIYPKVMITEAMALDRHDLKHHVGRQLVVVAWLWTRTVICPNPACGASMPLATSYWLSKAKGKEAWVQPVTNGKQVCFQVRVSSGPPPEPPKYGRGARFRCEACSQPTDEIYVKAEGMAGRIGQQLLAIALEGGRGRIYVDPLPEHQSFALGIAPSWKPEQELPHEPRAIWCKQYGLLTFGDLFTNRQLATLNTIAELIQSTKIYIEHDARSAGFPDIQTPLEIGGTGAKAYAEAVTVYLSFLLSAISDDLTTIVTWRPGHGTGATRSTFARQGIPMAWDYAEANPFANAGGDLASSANAIARAIETLPARPHASCTQVDAAALPHSGLFMFSTDPPYYDNVGYADLSDFFYIWLRRSLRDVFPSLTRTVLTPKSNELIASRYRERTGEADANSFFEEGLRKVFGLIGKNQVRELPIAIYYAFKQAETDEHDGATASTGWDTMLSGLLKAGLSVHATWPIRTERGARSVGIGANVLASSIVLACRPRSIDAPTVTRNEFVAKLKHELPDAVKRLQEANIAPVDLAQSAIGPGMAVFSSFEMVLEANGAPMSVRSALVLINQVLDEILAAEEAEYDADTRWAITWFTQYGFERAVYGDAETLSKARNTSVLGLERAGIIEARGNKVRLLKRDELGTWHPTTDDRFTIWEACQHLIKTLDLDGEAAAARLLKQLDSRADAARDLAYRLYQHCDRKGDAEEARAYNGLVVAWPRLAALAAEEPRPVAPTLDFT